MPGDHAIHAPSSASRWSKCYGSAEAIARLNDYYEPEPDGEAAEEGTAAHDVIDELLKPLNCRKDVENDTVTVTDFDNLVGRPSDHDPAVYGISLVLDVVRKVLAQAPHVVWVEQRVRLSDKVWGRCDICMFEPVTRTVTIVDYKNGMRAVDPNTPQVRIYGAGSIRTHGLAGAARIRYCIVQPNDWRPFVPRVKWWSESRSSLDKWTEGLLANVGRSELIAGEHCRDCPLFGTCEPTTDALREFGTLINGFVNPANLRPDQVVKLWAMMKPIEDSMKGFRNAWTKPTVAAPGMKFVESTTHATWEDEEAVRAEMPVELLKLPTPNEAEKAGFKIAGKTTRPRGKKTLALADDSRKAWGSNGMFDEILQRGK